VRQRMNKERHFVKGRATLFIRLTRLELDRYIDSTYNQGRPILGQLGQLEQSEQSATDDN